jgi:hypothetical protein
MDYHSWPGSVRIKMIAHNDQAMLSACACAWFMQVLLDAHNPTL